MVEKETIDSFLFTHNILFLGRENMKCQEIPTSAGALVTPPDLRGHRRTEMFTSLRDRNPSEGSPQLKDSDLSLSLSYLTTMILIMTSGLQSRQGDDLGV